MKHSLFLSALALTASSVFAQTSVDYDDGALAQAPVLSFPFYNAGTGACRWQSFVPTSFGAMPQAPRYVSRIGFQIAGREVYKTFELRAGIGRFSSLSQDWAANLPDQRVQADRSGQPLVGGVAAAQWVEFELRHPFVWRPGDHIVVDLTTSAAVPGKFVSTARGTGDIPRLVDFSYTGGPRAPAPAQVRGGLKMRVVFESMQSVVPFGTGCAGAAGLVPRLGSVGLPQLGNFAFLMTLDRARPSAVDALVVGLNRVAPGFDLGGGCLWLTSAEMLLFGQTSNAGGDVRTLPLPTDPSLAGATVHCQWAIVDPAAPSQTGWSLSQGGSLVLYK